jgi:hypothetical protein
MDTYEARRRMRDLAQESLDLLREIEQGDSTRSDALTELRKMELEARSLLADAGYPGESAWRALQRVGPALRTDDEDPSLVAEVVAELGEAIDTLDSLTATPSERDSDFRIIG